MRKRATARKLLSEPEPKVPAPPQEFLPRIPNVQISKELAEAFHLSPEDLSEVIVAGLASSFLSHLGHENLSPDEIENIFSSNDPAIAVREKAAFAKAIAYLRANPDVLARFEKKARERLSEIEKAGQSAALPAKIVPPATAHVRKMVNDERSFMHEGVRYFPLSVAAPIIQVPRTTLVDWIKKGKLVAGQPLQVHFSKAAGRNFISEESIERAALRFVKWPSEQPAGVVHLGEKGYVGLKQAARDIGISDHTMWLWAARQKAPVTLDVIKCPVSEQYYLGHTEIPRLKKLIPKSGLRRGPRPHLTPTVT